MTRSWARGFEVSAEDVDYLQGLLLEREIPLSLEEIALILIEKRLQEQQSAFQEQYQGVITYRPAESYEVGGRVAFPSFDFSIAEVVSLRKGNNPDLGQFQVIKVRFEDGHEREFAANLQYAHPLNAIPETASTPPSIRTPQQILQADRDLIFAQITKALQASDDLIRLSGNWFSRTLMIDINEGYLHLAEAVLDMYAGGALTTPQILKDIGGLGTGSDALQEFCLNNALNEDPRFDEVGPLDTVLWYLRRLEPAEVQKTPDILHYNAALPYDSDSLTPEQTALEIEIDDEWSPVEEYLDEPTEAINAVSLVLLYSHRRAGTLPLSSRMRQILPTARKSPRIAITLVDAQDNEEYSGWVVRHERYVYGLAALYRKHKLPVGAHITARRDPSSDKIVVDFQAHRPRSEWVRLIVSKNGQMGFEDQKRAIGAGFDDLMILGADDLAFVDDLFRAHQSSNKSLSSILRMLMGELSRANTQGAVHAKTLYSALNVLRRYPPGPMFAALNGDSEFDYVGNHYWRMSGS